MNFRKLLIKLHLYAGVAAGAVLLVAGLTGSVLTMEAEIDRWLNPTLWYLEPRAEGTQRKSVDQMIEQILASFPKARPGGLRAAASPDLAFEFSLNDGRIVYIDPFTMRILGWRKRSDMITVSIHNLHTRLLAGETGEYIAGGAAVILMMLSISGLVLWWPRKIVSLTPGASWVRMNWEAHQISGILSFIVLLTFSWSGAMITFGEWLQPMIYSATHSEPWPDPPEVTPVPGGKRIPFEQAIRAAEVELPGSKLSLCSLGGPPTQPIRVSFKYPEDRTPGGRTRVYVDPFSGAVIRVDSTRKASAGTRILQVNRSLHTGDIYGVPTRVFAGFGSLMVVVQAVTGLLIWGRRTFRRRREDLE